MRSGRDVRLGKMGKIIEGGPIKEEKELKELDSFKENGVVRNKTKKRKRDEK